MTFLGSRSKTKTNNTVQDLVSPTKNKFQGPHNKTLRGKQPKPSSIPTTPAPPPPQTNQKVVFVNEKHNSPNSPNNKIMPRTNVKNPFKEKRSLWIHYLIILGIAFTLTCLAVIIPQYWSLSITITTGEGGTEGSGNTVQQKNQILTVSPKKPNKETLHKIAESFEKHKDKLDKEKEKKKKQKEVKPKFPNKVTQDEYPTWLHEFYTNLVWHKEGQKVEEVDDTEEDNNKKKGPEKKKLTKEILQQSFDLGCQNIATNQNSQLGNFNYQYDFVNSKWDNSDNQVRQAGALWGIVLCYQHEPNNSVYKAASEKGLQFFIDHSVPGPTDNTIVVQYLQDASSEIGTGCLIWIGHDWLFTYREYFTRYR